MNRRYLGLALLPAAALLLAGCGGGGGSTSDNAAAAAPSGAAGNGGGAGGGGRGGPAASGEIAAVSGNTLQVQNSSSQTAVTWSAKTTFTKTATATLAVGDCVLATGEPGSGNALTATSIRVQATSGGDCTFDRGNGNGGARPSGMPSGARPSGFPSGGTRPSGAPGGGGRDFATAVGKVTAVAGSTVTLTGTIRSGGFGGGGASPSATPTATPTTGPVTLTLGSAATVTEQVKATSADAKVGTCASATGTADSSGTVAATAITLSTKGANGCNAGFGGFPGGRNG